VGVAPPGGFRRLETGRVVLVARQDLLPALLDEGFLGRDGLERALERGEPLAQGRGKGVRLALGGLGMRLCLRPALHGGWLGPLLGDRFTGLGRPLRELRVTARLHQRGAPVPAPAFVWGRRDGPWHWRVAVSTLNEEATVDALSFLRQRPGRDRVRSAAIALGQAVRRFHDAGGQHADLHLGNLLLRREGAGTSGLVVDLDRARLSAPDGRRRMAELMRLLRSVRKWGLLPCVGSRGVSAFLAAYCQGDRALRRSLLARLPAERRWLRLHTPVRSALPGGSPSDC